MIIDGIEVEQFNNQEYVLINKYIFKGEKIYYFANLNDEIFCAKKEENYVPITDSFKLNLFRNIFGSMTFQKNVMYLPKDIKGFLEGKLDAITSGIHFLVKKQKCSPEITQKIIQEQEHNFRGIKQKFNLDISIPYCDSVLRIVDFYRGLSSKKAEGIYRPADESIEYKDHVIDDWDSRDSKTTRLHECIHAMTGKMCFFYGLYFLSGLLEGETENLSAAYFGDEGSCKGYSHGKDFSGSTNYNFPEDTSYKDCVCIIRQMEAATGKKSFASIINGDLDFEIDFIKKYGLRALMYLAGKTNLMKQNCFGNRDANLKLLKDTQDKLLTIVFDKDFKSINSLEDAQKYFEKLRNFESQRARITYREGNPPNKFYNSVDVFESYYSQKFEEAKRRLEELGLSPEEIETGLEGYGYEMQQFYPQEEHMGYGKKQLATAIYATTKPGEDYDLDSFRLYRSLNKSGEWAYFTVKDNEDYVATSAIDRETGEYKFSVATKVSFDRIREIHEKEGWELIDITDSIDREELLAEFQSIEELKEEAENWWKEKQNEKQEEKEKSLVPVKKDNIFKRFFKGIKEVIDYWRKGPQIVPTEPIKEKETEEKKKPEEKKLPSWDMRNYSEEEQEKARRVNGEVQQEKPIEPQTQTQTTENEK